MKRWQKRRKNRKIWTGEWLRNRTICEACCTLLAELRNVDISSYRNFLHRTGTEKSRTDWSVDWCYQKLYSSSVDSNSSAAMLIFRRSRVTPNSKAIGWNLLTSGHLLNGIEPSSIFVQQRSTTFYMLKGIFQLSTPHDSLFNICRTEAATFVAQQMLNRVSLALVQHNLLWIFHLIWHNKNSPSSCQRQI